VKGESPVDPDVVIVGGALSGAATAMLLLQEDPSLKILIVEKSVAFSRRVGEATVELSTYFLTRCLGLTRYLNESHINKNGLRFWFTNERTKTIEECGEIGGKYLSRVGAYLIDRAGLDEEILRRAVKLGAELWRPAQVTGVQLNPGGLQVVTVKRGDQSIELRPRWLVDASGVAAYLARQNGWWRQNQEHPTAAVWSRWKGVGDFEDFELTKRFPEWAGECFGVRGTATNHLMGEGWWAWWIPLKGGDVSIGVTYDLRLVKFPEEGAIGDRLKSFLMRHPVAAELMKDATWTEGDVHWRKNLAYYSTVFAGDGFSLVGDAAGFIDPFYSPGMDWIAFLSFRTRDLILKQRMGEPMKMLVEKHNQDFTNSYRRWFEALYKDKYEYFNEFDLMKVAFLLDIGLYYFGVAVQPFKRGKIAFSEPCFSTQVSVPFYRFMKFYNARFAAMARSRRRRGMAGVHNFRTKFLFPGFNFSRKSAGFMVGALLGWLRLELTEGWRSWRKPVSDPMPAESLTVPRQSEIA